MVGCNGYRNPALYAKIASTVDVASHGRLYAGIGAGWYEHEWKAYGYEWTETREPDARVPRGRADHPQDVDRGSAAVFKGEYYSIDKPYNEPKGVRKPHPSLWIGGGGEQVTLKLVAQYANACNVGGGNPEIIAHKLDVLKGHCDKLGRDYDEIIKSTSLNVFPLDGGRRPGQGDREGPGRHPLRAVRRTATIIGTPAADHRRDREGTGRRCRLRHLLRRAASATTSLLQTVEDAIKQFA